MLGRIGNIPMPCEAPRSLHHEDKYKRNEVEDMKKGIEILYEFREKLFALHPVVIDAIENMLQRPRY
jgi:hypothetical protein